MSIFISIYQNTIGRILPNSASSQPKPNRLKKRKMDEVAVDDQERAARRRKREDSQEFERRNEVITKRRRVDEDRYAPIVNGETYESAEIEGAFAGPMDTNHNIDQLLMPPPALSPFRSKMIDSIVRDDSRRSSMDFDGASQLSQRQRPADEFSNEYSMERARRHAAATTLPPNSGIWEAGERDLFFHLSYRGFEPLFPENWMQDFETLPLSLYARKGDPEPLIRNYKTKEFRAIRELRDLLNLGKAVRDKVLASPGVKREAIIEKAVNKYISWALTDVGLKPPSLSKPTKAAMKNTLPIHVVAKLKSRQTTQECLLEMKNKLHALATRHRQASNIQTSIEHDHSGYATPDLEDETRIAETSEDDLPVLYGIMICRSILAIFTMNSQTPPPKYMSSAYSHHMQDSEWNYRPSPAASESVFGNAREIQSVTSTERNLQLKKSLLASTNEERSEAEDDTASDPRFISDFDFSDPGKDVWNALVIAIVAMQIRKDMLALQTRRARTKDSIERLTARVEDSSVMDVDEDDDPDA
ncbi:hypothetical protein H2198_007785 [Neophaeococcomyces mojaviensis]|uniref:Uncharacterized protein n=1 Tax=Neophaeococcomyces mojaviensis TaxID=3383035 RepID=A0ACC2ZZ41_9EURO|nr:hypothetical protein H2198_007785 [Knufia sp. JES_112]